MSFRTLGIIALVGMLSAVSYAAGTRLRIKWREEAAAEALTAVVDAQREFRVGGGRGGYATSLASLTTACPDTTAVMLSPQSLAADGYDISIRVRGDQAEARTDCHGRPTASDFIATAEPIRVGVDGLRAMSASASGPIFVFFDGVAPREADMAAGGLAMPLDDLRRIP